MPPSFLFYSRKRGTGGLQTPAAVLGVRFWKFVTPFSLTRKSDATWTADEACERVELFPVIREGNGLIRQS